MPHHLGTILSFAADSLSSLAARLKHDLALIAIVLVGLAGTFTLAGPAHAVSAPLFADGTIVKIQSSDVGTWWTRCRGCQDGALLDTIVLTKDGYDEFERFKVINTDTGVMLETDIGSVITYCNGCISGAATNDTIGAAITIDRDNPFNKFRIKRLSNGTYTLKASNDKYVTRCRKCSPSFNGDDIVTAHVTDPSLAPAQWKIVVVASTPIIGELFPNLNTAIEGKKLDDDTFITIEAKLPESRSIEGDCAGCHIQGMTITQKGRIILTHSVTEGDKGYLLWSDRLNGDKTTFQMSNKFLTNPHPSALQAVGEVFAVTDNDDENSSASRVRFFEIDQKGNIDPDKYSHLTINKQYNGIGFLRHTNGNYYLVGDTSAEYNRRKYVDLYRLDSATGHACKDLADHSCGFSLVAKVGNPTDSDYSTLDDRIATSASNTHLVSKSADELWVVAMYSPTGGVNELAGDEFISVSAINVSSQHAKIVIDNQDLGSVTSWRVKTQRPSARWGAGIGKGNGQWYLFWARRGFYDKSTMQLSFMKLENN